MTHEMNVRDVYFNKIKKGDKIYEIRLNDEKRQKIKIGDILTIKNNSNLEISLTCLVDDLTYFDSFEDMAKTLPKETVGFEQENVSQIVDIYHDFYSLENEKKYGVVAIKLKLL